MYLIAFVLALGAAVLFAIEGLRPPRPYKLVAIGLCLLTVAWILQVVHPVANVHF